LSPSRLIIALPAVAAALVAAGCSGVGPQSDAHPSVNFGTDVSTTPGMAGMPGIGSPGVDTTMPTASSASPPVAGQAPQGPNAVNIDNFAFAPLSLTVHVGDTVTWANHDEEPHTVAAGDGSFHSPGMDTGATYSFTFTKAGSYDYICSIHPFMHGTVVVTS
jgi:amicyanin